MLCFRVIITTKPFPKELRRLPFLLFHWGVSTKLVLPDALLRPGSITNHLS